MHAHAAAAPSEGAHWERRPGEACAPLPPGYRPRDPERTTLHTVARESLETMLQQVRDGGDGAGLPRYVEQEFRRFLRCGILAHGFARVRCGDCGHCLVVAFSCKGRGVCPSCAARRMHDTAAHLVERVLPVARWRQWTLSFPWKVRFALARDARLVGAAARELARAVRRWQRRQARLRGYDDAATGAVTFVQRFGSRLNLNVHLHTLVPDAVWVRGADGRLRQVDLPGPEQADVEAVLARLVRRMTRRLSQAGVTLDEQDAPAPDDALASAQAEAMRAGLFGRALDPEDADPRGAKHLCATRERYSLHAATSVPPGDRARLEYLCRYGARGPLAEERLSRADNGDVVLRLPRRGPDRATHLRVEPERFLRRLAMLVPPPRSHLVRYAGVFAPAFPERAQVVPSPPEPAADPPVLPRPVKPRAEQPRLPWAELLARTFAVDVLRCARCGGRMQVLAYLTEAEAVRRVLEHLRLPADPPPVAPARGPPEPELAWDAPEQDAAWADGDWGEG